MKKAQCILVSKYHLLLEAGKVYDRAGLTRAGRAFQKHAERSAIWGDPEDCAEICNERGQAILSDIVCSEETWWTERFHPRYGLIVEGYLPDGRGARWKVADIHFLGFLEPR